MGDQIIESSGILDSGNLVRSHRDTPFRHCLVSRLAMRQRLSIRPANECIRINIAFLAVVFVKISVPYTGQEFRLIGHRLGGLVKAADQLGGIFNHDMRSLGVDVRLEAALDGAPTARSLILITGDGQRTMQTYLGACTELSVGDITPQTIGTPKAVLIEGYVWDLPEGPDLTSRAIEIAKQNGTAVALSLSDSFCVERHRDSFEHAVRNGVDIVVADEALFDSSH